MRFIPTTTNVSIWVNYEKKIIINIYIDDVIDVVKKLQLFNKFEIQFKEKFEVKFFGKAKLILGMQVKKDIKCKIFHINHMYYI